MAAAGAVLAAAIGAGVIRLLPWLLAPEVPLEVCWPFAKALAAVAVETAFLIGIPTGYALGAAVFVERGEARALLGLGARPAVLVAKSGVAAVVLAALAFLASVVWGADASSPGRFAAQLIQQGRTSCARALVPRSVEVPLVGVTWLCFPDRKPRVVGPLPGAGQRAWFTATDLAPSEDLRSFALGDLRLSVRGGRPSERPALRLHASTAIVSGLSPWGRPKELPLRKRAGLTALTGSGLGLLVSWLLVAGGRARRLSAATLGAAPALTALVILHALDRRSDRPLAYLLVPLGAGIAALLWTGLLHALAEIRTRLAPATGER